ncbi:MAG: hypothetical protein RLZZ543_1755, partial [Bacteroidota bacterium]
SIKWQGLQKMNLNGSANDPSMIRAKLCWDILRDAELPGARSSFVKLYINGQYKGLYSNIEHIDENFAEAYYPQSQYSSQFKCLYPATLEYINSNPSSYNFYSGDRRPYDQTINDYTQDYREFATFVSILNQTPIADLPCALERRFDVDQYLHYAALDVLMGNWDGYIYNKNNFYLQLDYHTGRFHYLPYDLDNTLGIDWMGQDWTTRNVMSWAPSNENRPLYKRLLQVPEYASRYQQYIRDYTQTVFQPALIAARAQQYITLIAPAVVTDQYHSLDFGFSYNDFLQSATDAWGGHVAFGINDYVTSRKTTALQQTVASTLHAQLTGGWVSMDNQFAFAEIHGTVTGLIQMETSSLSDMSSLSNTFSLLDNGVFPDVQAGDGIYSASLQLPPFETDRYYYRFRYDDNSDNSTQYWPCVSRTSFLESAQIGPLFNEAMSDNSACIPDLAGNYSDWIECYNPTFTSYNFDGVYLSNKRNYLNKWPAPAISMGSNTFKLFWANSDEELNRNNTNFKLSASGDSIFLYRKIDDTYQLLDQVVLPALAENSSYGHPTDGAASWMVFDAPLSTPNASNGSSGILVLNAENKSVFPNPVSTELYMNFQAEIIRVFDAKGSLILTKYKAQSLNVSDFTPGLYIVQLDGKSFRVVVE